MRVHTVICVFFGLTSLYAGDVFAQWCVPSEGPDTLNTYGPSSPTITNVTIGSINRTTPASDKELYVDTGEATDVSPGDSVAFSMTYQPDVLFCPDYQLRVWIDWDQDGSFDGADETVFSVNNDVSSVLAGSIDVPDTAVEGVTRMRVAMKMELACGHDAILACPEPEAFGWHGEIEDYTINVASGHCVPVIPINDLYATKLGGSDVDMTWLEAPSYESYSIYAVTSEDPAMIAEANGAGMVSYPTQIENICSRVLGPCVDPGRVPVAPNLALYQVVGVCPDGVEGPNQ